MNSTVYRTDSARKSAINSIDKCIESLLFSNNYIASRNITKYLSEYKKIIQDELLEKK